MLDKSRDLLEDHVAMLQHEFDRFEKELPQLLQTMPGQYVLIHRDDPLEGPYKTENEAYEAGCIKYGVEPFLVMPVEEHLRVVPLVSIRLANPCRS